MLAVSAAAQNPHLVVYQGDKGPGHGKHIVFLAGDHEYRSEESLPALARILAKHYGFKCSVFFTTDPKTGFIEPGSSNIAGLEALKTADLLVVFLRFQDFPGRPDAAHRRLPGSRRAGRRVSARPRMRFRSSAPDAKFLKFDWQNKDEYPGGFGRQILGETWVSHYGTNHKQSSRLLLRAGRTDASDSSRREGRARAVGRLHGQSDRGSHVLARGQILDGMTPDSPPAAGQGADAGRLVSHLHERVRQVGPRVHDDAWRVGGSAERRIPADERQRVSLGGGLENKHQARQATSASSARSTPRRLRSAGSSKA